jgi:hypothetical protein
LYEDYFHDKRKAAARYREYLNLAPSAPDSAQVRGWLLEMELNP